MTHDELTLVLDALKFCHGGEPCGTAEAIAVVEKALANVATNDTSKEYVDEMQKQRHEQEPVAWKLPDKNVVFWEDTKEVDEYHGFEPTIPLYPHPQRTWVGLTAGEILDTLISVDEKTVRLPSMLGQFACAIEAKLKEKNT